jgi:rRNA-processing protein FCF1
MGSGEMIKAIISDANILIDYAKANKRILSLAANNLYEIYVPTAIVAQVKDISDKEIKLLGIKIIEPEYKQIKEASAHDPGTSSEDRLCCIIARDKKWTCATNDRKLRRFCDKEKVTCIWEFEIMLELVRRKHLSTKEAIKTAKDIAAINPRIKESVVTDFITKIGSI